MQYKKTVFNLLMIILVIALSGTSCNMIIKPDEYTAIEDGVRAMAYLNQPAEHDPVITGPIGAEDPKRPADLAGYYTTVYKYNVAQGFDQGICLDPNASVFWPGAIIDANTITTGGYRPVILPRKPITISISLKEIAGSSFRTIGDPKLSTVRDAIKDIVQQGVTGPLPANLSFDTNTVHQEKQVQYAMGAYLSGFGHSISGMFSYNNSNVRTCMMVRVYQEYYSLDIDDIAPTDFFQDSVTYADLLNALGSDTCPVYVSSVKYGRMALFSIETTANRTETEAAIRYAYSGIISGGASMETKYKNIIETATIKGRIFGGDGSAASDIIVNGFYGFKAWLTKEGEINTIPAGAPLSYTLRYLKDNSIARIVLADEFYVRDTTKIYNKFRLTLNEIEHMNNHGVTFGTITFNAYSGYGSTDLTNDRVATLSGTPFGGSQQSYPINTTKEYTFDLNRLSDAYIRLHINVPEGPVLPPLTGKGSADRTLTIQECLDNIEINGYPGDNPNGCYYLVCNYSGGKSGTLRVSYTIEPID